MREYVAIDRVIGELSYDEADLSLMIAEAIVPSSCITYEAGKMMMDTRLKEILSDAENFQIRGMDSFRRQIANAVDIERKKTISEIEFNEEFLVRPDNAKIRKDIQRDLDRQKDYLEFLDSF